MMNNVPNMRTEHNTDRPANTGFKWYKYWIDTAIIAMLIIVFDMCDTRIEISRRYRVQSRMFVCELDVWNP